MHNHPAYISIVFILTAFTTLLLFYVALRRASSSNAAGRSNFILAVSVTWLTIQAYLSLHNFYDTNTTSIPPKFMLCTVPPLLCILILFAMKKGRSFIDSLPVIDLARISIVRIPVELVLYWLFLCKAVPELMTFSGRNFDILSGITVPFVVYFGLKTGQRGKKILLAWNFIALALLLNILINALLSAPFAFQQFAFTQPNVAVLYFPYSWLPGFIVPVILFSHLVSIRQLLKRL